MQQAVSTVRRGRPSVHPVVVRYHESPAVVDAIRASASEHGLTFAEAQRLVNRGKLSLVSGCV